MLSRSERSSRSKKPLDTVLALLHYTNSSHFRLAERLLMHFALIVFFVVFLVPFIVEPKGTQLLWANISLLIGKALLVLVPIAMVGVAFLGMVLIVATVFWK
jgi:hypothetical protein